MEEFKQSVSPDSTTLNSEDEQQTATTLNYDRRVYFFSNAQDSDAKTTGNAPRECETSCYNKCNREDNEYASSVSSKTYIRQRENFKAFQALPFNNSLQNGENHNEVLPMDSALTPQGFWRKRCEQRRASFDTEAKGSPSRFVSLYKTRMPTTPSGYRARGARTSSDGGSHWLSSARKIRLQCNPEKSQRSHSRSLSFCNAQARSDEFKGILRRPRRSLDSASGTAVQNMHSSPQNKEISFSQGAYSSWGIGAVLDNEVQPEFESYQLVGDSLLLRFAEQILNIPSGTVEGSRGIGLCVSGQKTGDLLRRVHMEMYPVSEKIVLLIGTNDVLQNTPEKQMCATLTQLLNILKNRATRIVLLTLPPIPKLQLRSEHWDKIEYFNNYIRSLQDDTISIADIHPLYITEKRGCKMEMFERYYGDGQRIDLIHLNRSGLEEIQQFLLHNNFVN